YPTIPTPKGSAMLSPSSRILQPRGVFIRGLVDFRGEGGGAVAKHLFAEVGPPVALLRLLCAFEAAAATDSHHAAERFAAQPRHVVARADLLDEPPAADVDVEHFVGPVVVHAERREWVAGLAGGAPLIRLAGRLGHQSLLDPPECGVRLQRRDQRIEPQ